MKNIFTLIIIALFAIASACKPKAESGENSVNEKLKVVATTGMLYDAIINIAGDKVTAEALMQPGVDPHLYKATQGDLNKLTEADLIVYNGLHLEGKMGEIFEKVARLKPTLPAAESIDHTKLRKLDGDLDLHDPHVWFDASLWKEVVQAISLKLIELRPQHQLEFETNTKLYLEQLDELHNWTKIEIATIPLEHRIMITAHDAFGYFGDAYDIEVKGLQGISTLSDFGLKDVAELVNLIINRNIKSIFIETSVSPKAIEAVAAGCKQKGHQVNIGGKLYSDAMGEDGTPEGTYVGMFRANVKTIVAGLE
jgi:manganese/zinc/iron transport system substrate-binding protein